jgi:hypothetical protein
VEKLVAPSNETVEKVLEWLMAHPLVNRSHIELRNDFLNIVLPSQAASELLNCNFYRLFLRFSLLHSNRFHHIYVNKTVARCLEKYSVPADISDLLDFIGGVSHFPKIPAKKPIQKLNRQDPGLGVTPRIIRYRYQIGDAYGKSPKNRQAVAQFLDQFYDEFDLEEFFALFYW